MSESASLRRTALYDKHLTSGARLVPFAGWEMPLQYSGILAEVKVVRSGAGLFDVSHMGRLEIWGQDSAELLEQLLTARVADLRPGRARYSMICNENGGIIDDVVLYRLEEARFLLVCNAGNKAQVLSWITGSADTASSRVTVHDRTAETVMTALQGPQSEATLIGLLGDLESFPGLERPFGVATGNLKDRPVLLSRTGYTGEDGFELVLEAEDGPARWDQLLALGAVPCGLGARDVLRLEAGLALHGHDIDPCTTPLEAGLERFVRLDKEFIGVEALRRQHETGVTRRLVGLQLEGRALARPDYPVLHRGQEVGKITSGTFSPSLGTSIAMGYVPPEHAHPNNLLKVDLRGRMVEARVTPLPFYRRKKGS